MIIMIILYNRIHNNKQNPPPRPNQRHRGFPPFQGFIRVLRHDSEDAFCGVDTDPSKGQVVTR